jgi:hypothetical protein
VFLICGSVAMAKFGSGATGLQGGLQDGDRQSGEHATPQGLAGPFMPGPFMPGPYRTGASRGIGPSPYRRA